MSIYSSKLSLVQTVTSVDRLVIAGVELRSRLFLGTGKYPNDAAMLAALEASGCELVTVALRRLDLDDPNKRTILDVIDWTRYRMLGLGYTSSTGQATTFNEGETSIASLGVRWRF